MTTQTLEVVFQNGAFHHVGGVSVPFTEGQHAKIVVEIEEKAVEQTQPRIAGLHTGLVGWDPSFDDELPDSFWLRESL